MTKPPNTFGVAFGRLVKKHRGIEGLTQQQLAIRAFGDESYKSRISELENGRVSNPRQKTVDALIVALNISDRDLKAVQDFLNDPPLVGTLIDFFDIGPNTTMEIEIAANPDKAVLFHNRPLRVALKRVEFFIEEDMVVLMTLDSERRSSGLPMGKDLARLLKGLEKIMFVYLDDKTGQSISGDSYPLKVIE